MAYPRHRFWPDALGYAEVSMRVHRHRQITDAYLAALARHHGGKLVGFDSGQVALHADVVLGLEEGGGAQAADALMRPPEAAHGPRYSRPMSLPGDSSFDKTLGEQAYASGATSWHSASAHALPVGHRLGELQIERVLGEGGFGIVYLAHDTQLGRHVALKEYMPGAMAGRGPDLSVALRSERDRSTFDLGLRSFVNEARLLARLDHPTLVKVHRFWEERDTAYMVMPYYPGQTLRQWLRARPEAPDEAWLRALLEPLLDVLAYLHSQNIYHRDVSPENILLLPQGRPVLLDFGAARLIVGDSTQNLTAILKQGYAPIEQYAESVAYRQGAWTDLYALAAVLYFAIGGKAPMPSVARLMNDDLPRALQMGRGRYSSSLLAWVDACMAVQPEQRPRDVAAARSLLTESGREPEPVSAPQAAPADAVLAAVPTAVDGAAAALPQARARQGWALLAASIALGLGLTAWVANRPGTPARVGLPEPDASVSAAPVMPAAAATAPTAVPTATAPGQTTAPTAAPLSVHTEHAAASAPASAQPQASTSASALPPVKMLPRPTALPRSGTPRQAAQCAELLQRLSLGEDNAALRQALASLHC